MNTVLEVNRDSIALEAFAITGDTLTLEGL